MNALLDALERARLDFDLGPVADLWRSGYQPSAEELDALAVFTTDGKKRATRRRVAMRARAVLRYKELRADKWSATDALKKVAEEFQDVHVISIRNAIERKDSAVNSLLRDWTERGAKD